MMWSSKFNRSLLATVGLVSLLNVLPGTMLSAFAQSNDNQGLPPGTVGGGSRGSVTCSAHEPLIAFAPETDILKTINTQPSLWVYLPASSSSTNAEFVLYDETETAIVDLVFPVADHSGLLKLDLTAIAQTHSLDPNHNYRWFFSLICPGNRAADVSVDGWLNFTALSPAIDNQLDNTTDPIATAEIYMTAGLWSEAISTLVDSYESSPTTIHPEAWSHIISLLNPVENPLDLTTAYHLTLSPTQY